MVSVEPTTDPGRSRWLGDGPSMSYEFAQAIRRVVSSAKEPSRLSRRANAALADAKADLWWFDATATTLYCAPNERLQWWTHGGTVVNLRIAWRLHQLLGQEIRADEMAVTFPDGFARADALELIAGLQSDPMTFDAAAFRPLAEKLKFFEALPESRVVELSRARFEVAKEVRLVCLETARGVST